MATVKLDWRELPTADGIEIHRCEVRARNGGDALFMDVVHHRGRSVLQVYNVTAYYWLEDSQRRIPLYDDEKLRSLDDAKKALTQWYLNNAPTLLVTLAG